MRISTVVSKHKTTARFYVELLAPYVELEISQPNFDGNIGGYLSVPMIEPHITEGIEDTPIHPIPLDSFIIWEYPYDHF